MALSKLTSLTRKMTVEQLDESEVRNGKDDDHKKKKLMGYGSIIVPMEWFPSCADKKWTEPSGEKKSAGNRPRVAIETVAAVMVIGYYIN